MIKISSAWETPFKTLPDINYGPFRGDGRAKVQPTHVPPGTSPIAITNSQARRMIEAFIIKGSTHSKTGSTAWVIWAWSIWTGKPILIKFHPGYGSHYELAPEI